MLSADSHTVKGNRGKEESKGKMKKRIVAMLIVVMVVAMSITGCGKEQPSQATGELYHGETTPPVSESAETAEAEDVRAEDTEVLQQTDERSIYEVASFVLEAYRNLDYEALKPYMVEDEYTELADAFKRIRSNEADTEFWKKTVGTMVYLEDSDTIVAKSIDYIICKWYMDCCAENAELPDRDAENFPVEYLDSIYEKYYADAKWEMVHMAAEIFVKERDGAFFFYPDHIGELLGCERLYYILDHTSSYGEYEFSQRLRSYLLLDSEACFSLGYEYIYESIPECDEFLSGDLDRMVAVLDTYITPETDGFYYEEYQYYYQDEANRAILQSVMNDRCELYRDLSDVVLFMRIDYDCLYPYDTISLAEGDRAFLQENGMEVVYCVHMFECPDLFWDNNFRMFSEIAGYAHKLGLVERYSRY